MMRSLTDPSSSCPRKKHCNRLHRNPIVKLVSHSLVSLRRSVARSFPRDGEDAEMKTNKTPNSDGSEEEQHDDMREYMDNYASKLAVARGVIDAIASVGGEVFEFEATLPGDDGSSLEARSQWAKMEDPKLEIQPSTMSKAEEAMTAWATRPSSSSTARTPTMRA